MASQGRDGEGVNDQTNSSFFIRKRQSIGSQTNKSLSMVYDTFKKDGAVAAAAAASNYHKQHSFASSVKKKSRGGAQNSS